MSQSTLTCAQLEKQLSDVLHEMDDNVIDWLEAKARGKQEVATKRHAEWTEMEADSRRLERRLRRRRKRGTCPGDPNPKVAHIGVRYCSTEE